jgi:hypothetical protein
MSPEVSQDKSVKTRSPGRPAEELAQYAFDSEKGREAGLKSAEARRKRREELAAGPREALAMGLMDELTTLREVARKLVQDAASDKVTVRSSARKDLAGVLNQALGTIETRKPADDSSPSDTLPQDREARMRLLAELEQRLTED